MATVTGLTATRMLAIEAASVVDGDIVGDNLILTKHDGSTINAGNVRGPQGDAGPAGSASLFMTAQPILEVGVSGQIKAGRVLTATDFTDMGLSAPIGLYNLSGLTDASGNGRNLSNKGSVPFTAKGIGGAASTAALFAGSTAQALYVADAGAGDPFRIRTGSVGCWFRTCRGGIFQGLVTKYNSADGQHCYWLQINSSNVLNFGMTSTGLIANAASADGVTFIVDNRWHFGVATYDGSTIRLYVDGIQEAQAGATAPIFAGSAPFNIGALKANASTAAANPSYGSIDEAFITSDVLTEDQIRNLYCAKIAHGFGSLPKSVSLRVRRRRRGASLISGDFPTQPVRLYNFSGGALTDAGSNGTTLTNSGSAVAVAGADGLAGNAFSFVTGSAQQLTSTDTGLPSGTGSRSYGCWFKQTSFQVNAALISWGNGAGTAAQAIYINNGGIIYARSISDDLVGPFVTDGKWHFVVVTEENAPTDGAKRKLYVDGRHWNGSLTLNSITLGGANKFRIGQWADGSGGGAPPFNGEIDGVFVCNYVLSPDDISALYCKGSQAMAPSPKNAGDHIEAMDATNLLCLFDSLESQHQIDLVVA